MPAKRTCLPTPLREQYIEQIAKSGVTRITVGCKNRYIDEFMQFCAETLGHADPTKVTTDDVTAFAEHLLKTIVKRETTATKLRELAAWYNWLHDQKKIQTNPLDGVTASELMARATRSGNRR